MESAEEPTTPIPRVPGPTSRFPTVHVAESATWIPTMRVLTAPTHVYADYTRVPTTRVPGPGPTKTRVSTAATRVYYTAYTTRVPTAATRVHTACTIATRVPGPTVATRTCTRVYTVSTTWISATRAPTNGDEP